jgi:hypothetical protein
MNAILIPFRLVNMEEVVLKRTHCLVEFEALTTCCLSPEDEDVFL